MTTLYVVQHYNVAFLKGEDQIHQMNNKLDTDLQCKGWKGTVPYTSHTHKGQNESKKMTLSHLV